MSLAAALTRVQATLTNRDQDPLRFWHFACPQSQKAVELLSQVDEVYCRAANKAGKTELAVAAALAMLQKKTELDGVKLPRWIGRVDAVFLVLDHQQQKLGPQQTLLRLLGKWPHHARYKADGVLGSVVIKTVGAGSDQSDWSRLIFMSQENPNTGLGVRADIVIGDEPPIESVWREIRKSAHAGRRAVRIIAATPTLRRQWEWLRQEYGECPRNSVMLHENRAEVRWGLDANLVLTAEEKRKLILEYRNDPLRDARIHGDYVDTSGLCPFNATILQAMLTQCRDPEVVDWHISRETDTATGRTKTATTVQLQVWQKPAPGRRYYVPIDPSGGIEDHRKLHDPGGLLVIDQDSGDLCARYNGYIGSYGIGCLAAGLAMQYNGAVVDPETSGGWGEGVLRGLADSQYGNLARARRELAPGRWHVDLGFRTTRDSRAGMISVIQKWILDFQCGVVYARCPSREVIHTLMDCIVNADGKVEAPPGLHDEDLVLWGQSLRKRAQSMGLSDIHAVQIGSREQRLIREITGEVEPEEEAGPSAGLLTPVRRRILT